MKVIGKNFPILILLFLIGFSFVQCTDKTQKFIDNLVEDANKDNPRMMDRLTRLDSCEALPGHTMEYNYTLLFSASEGLDSVQFKANMTPHLIYNLQRSGEISKVLRGMDVTFIHSYKNEDGQQAGYIVIRPDDYKKEMVDIEAVKSHGSEFLNKNNLSESLQTIAGAMQSKLPLRMKEQNLTIIDCQVHNGNTLSYTYQLTDKSKADFDSAQYKSTAYANAVKTLTNAPIIQKIAENGAHIRYIYLDKDENYLCRIELSSEDLR